MISYGRVDLDGLDLSKRSTNYGRNRSQTKTMDFWDLVKIRVSKMYSTESNEV